MFVERNQYYSISGLSQCVTCVCLHVCVCVCVDCYSCSRMNQVQVRVSSHVFLDLQNNASFSSNMPSCLLGMPLQPFQKST